jgi:hypothetical protein
MSCIYTYKGKKYDSVNKVKNSLNEQNERIVEPILKYTDNIVLTNDKVSAIISGKNIDGNNKLQQYKEKALKGQEKIIALDIIDKLTKVIPGINIIHETDTTLKEKGIDNTAKGFIDSEGYHINVNKFTADTMVHELTELWLYMLKETDIVKYNNIINLAKEHMKSNQDVTSAILENYENIDDENLIREYISTISGFNSVSKVTKIIVKVSKLIDDNKSNTIFNKTRTIFTNIWNQFKNIFVNGLSTNEGKLSNMDFSSATFEDILDAITEDAINGSSIFTEKEGIELAQIMNNDKFLDDNKFWSKPLMGLTKINNIDDFDQYFTTAQDNNNKENLFGTKKARAKYILNNLVRIDSNGKKYIRYNGTKLYIYGTENNELIKSIEEHIIPEIDKSKNSDLIDIDKIVKSAKTKEEFNVKAKEKSQNKYSSLSYYPLQKMYEVSGLKDGFEHIVKASEVNNLNIPELANFYDKKIFGEYDPYVIIHGKKSNNSISISILDVVAESLNMRNSYLTDKNLLAASGMTDKEYISKGGNLKNNFSGIREFKMSLLITSILKNNKNVSINNTTIFSLPNEHFTYTTRTNVGDLYNDYKLIRESEIFNNVENQKIKELLNDNSLEKGGNSSYFELLANSVNSYDKDIIYIQEAYNKKITGNLESVNQHELLKRVKSAIRTMTIKAKIDGIDIKNKPDYQLLSGLLFELETLMDKNHFMFNNKDILKIVKSLQTAWNVKDPIAQGIIGVYQKIKFKLLENIKNSFYDIKKEKEAFYNKHKYDNAIEYAKAKSFNASSKLFEELFVKRNCIRTKIVNGKEVKVIEKVVVPFSMHYDENNENTKQALLDGTLSKEAFEYSKKIHEKIKSDNIAFIKHDHLMRYNETLTDKEALNLYNTRKKNNQYSDVFGEEYVPVIYKSGAELIIDRMVGKQKGYKDGKTSIVESIKRSLSDVTNDFDLFSEVSSEKDVNSITDKFINQDMDFNSVLKECGMIINANNELEIIDENKYSKISTNAEALYASHSLSVNRKIFFEEDFIPVYNSGMALIESKEAKYGNKLTNVKEYLEEYKKTLVERKSMDDELETDKAKKLAKGIRVTMRLFTNATLGFSLRVATKSWLLINEAAGITFMAEHIARLNEKNKDNINPELISLQAWTKAGFFIGTNWSFAWTLARKFQNIDGQEFDLLKNPVYNVHQRYVGQDNVMHIGNMTGDNLARVQAVIAYLMETGSLDAYSYDMNTGKISYDVKKDLKYYDKDGKEKTANGEHAIRKQVYEDNIFGGFQEEGKEMQLGESYKTMSHIKSIVDRFIIGSMSEDTRWQLNNHAFSKLITTFRLFGDERIFRSGLLGGTYNTSLGTGYKAIKDKYGNWVTVTELKQVEGYLQSFGAAFNELVILRNKNIKEFWNEASHERKVNIIKSIMQCIIGLLLFACFKAIVPDDDDDDKNFIIRAQKSYKFLYQDLFELYFIGDVIANPIPMMQLIEDTFAVLFSDREWKVFTRYVPGIKGSYQYTKETIGNVNAIINDDYSYYENLALQEKLDRKEKAEKKKLKNMEE